MFRKRSNATSNLSHAKALLPKVKSEEPQPGERYPRPGDQVYLNGFEKLELSDGQTVSLEDIMSINVGGIILFTYPQANTPGCTKQACQFRDKYAELKARGFSIYGISRDTPRANQALKSRLNLPYSLICDEQGFLIAALGLDTPENATIRGFIAIDKSGRVLASAAGAATSTGLEAIEPIIRAFEGLNCEPAKAFGTPTTEYQRGHGFFDSQGP